MKNILKNLYDIVALIPITLLIFAGVYQMCFGNLLGGILHGKISWTIPITQTMIIDTVITFVVVYNLIKGFPKYYKKLMNDSKTKGFATFLLLASVIIAILLFVLGKLYWNNTLFNINYILFMVVLILLCIIQKAFDNIIYPKKKLNN